MASGSATVTAKYGPGLQATSKVITGIKAYWVNLEKMTLQFKLVDDDPNGPAQEFDLTGVTTFTVTISGGNQTIVIS